MPPSQYANATPRRTMARLFRQSKNVRKDYTLRLSFKTPTPRMSSAKETTKKSNSGLDIMQKKNLKCLLCLSMKSVRLCDGVLQTWRHTHPQIYVIPGYKLLHSTWLLPFNALTLDVAPAIQSSKVPKAVFGERPAGPFASDSLQRLSILKSGSVLRQEPAVSWR